MAFAKNNSLTSQINQLMEEFGGVLGAFPSAADLFPADLFDAFCAQNCGIQHEHKTPPQFADYTG